jgi:hypothetical protein
MHLPEHELRRAEAVVGGEPDPSDSLVRTIGEDLTPIRNGT